MFQCNLHPDLKAASQASTLKKPKSVRHGLSKARSTDYTNVAANINL